MCGFQVKYDFPPFLYLQQTATCTLGRHAIKFTVEESRIYQANALLQEELFQDYIWNQQNENEQLYKFRINLAFLLDCLNIFGNSSGVQHTTMHFCYAGHGHALVVVYVAVLDLLNANNDIYL